MKNIKRLLIAATFLSCSCLLQAESNPKTFFMPRPHLDNLAMEYSLWHEHAYRPGKNNFNTHIQLTPFCQFSDNGDDIGKYFALENRNYFEITTDNTKDINSNNLGINIGDHGDVKVSLDPKQESWGARLDLFQNLVIPFKKLYLKASTPFFYVRNDLNASFEGTGYEAAINFFNGNYESTTGDANEIELDYAKIPTKDISKVGFGDIDFVLGYKLIDSEKHHFFFNFGLTAPIGTKPRGEYLFEPVYGNGNHFAAGFGLDASLKLWENNKNAARILAVLNYRYLFEGHEKRTIGIDIPDYKFAHYYKMVNAYATETYESVANILTKKISVRPGNMLEGLLNFAFTSSKFILDIGYNIFSKQAESIIVPPSTLKIEKVGNNYEIKTIDGNFNIDNLQTLPKELNTQTASTPSQLTHKIYAGLGYTFNVYEKYPMTFGLGSSYEFADSKNELEQYAFWLKGIVSF